MKQLNLRQLSAEFLTTTLCPMRERVSRLVGTGKGLLFALFMVFGLGVSQEAMAADPSTGYSINYPYLYFYNDRGFTNCSAIYGRAWDGSNYTSCSDMSKVSNTEKLYYVNPQTFWNNTYNQVAIIDATGWGGQASKIEDRWGYANGHTGVKYNESLNYHDTYYITSTGSSNISISYKSDGYRGIPKYAATIQVRTRNSTGDYSTPTTSPATVKLKGTYMSGNGATTRSEETWNGDKNYNVVITGKVTTSYTDMNSNYQFDGWYVGGSQVGTSSSYEYYQSAATTVVAKFTRIKYTVTLNQESGTGGTTSTTATYNSAMPSITVPTRTGYTFGGYYTSTGGSGTKYYNADGTSAKTCDLTADIELHAKWTANTNTAYTVKHYKQNLDGTYPSTATETQNLTGTTDASVTPSVKSYTGFTSPSTQTVTIAGAGTTVVEYKYARKSYTLTWALDGGTAGTGTITPAGSTKYETVLQYTVDPTKTGYNFTGWNPAMTSGTTTMPANNQTYTAQWTEKTFTVSATYGAGGASATVTTSPAGQITGTAINATASDGYAFSKWEITSGSGTFAGGGTTSTTASTTFYPTANATINAVFASTAVYYKWAFGVHTSGGGTIASTVAASDHVQGGTSITLTATPSSYYEVEGWYSDESCTSKISAAGTGTQYTFSLSADTKVYVKFVDHKYDVVVSHQYYDCPGSGTKINVAPYKQANETINDVLGAATGYTIDASGASKVGFYHTKWVLNKNASVVCNTKTTTTTTSTATIQGSTNSSSTLVLTSGYSTSGEIVNVLDRWREYSRTVSVYAKYGSGAPEKIGNDITVGVYTSDTTEIPNRTGYDFANWTKNENTGYDIILTAIKDEPINKKVTVSSSLSAANAGSIRANFTAHEYTITYNQNGGSGAENGTYTIESAAITLPQAPIMTKTGYTFGGWYTNSGLTGDAVTTIPAGSHENKVFWAKWNEVKVTIAPTVNAVGTTAGYSASASVAQIGITTPSELSTSAAGTGYTFTGWSLSDNLVITSGSTSSTTITVRTNGDGQPVTAEAVYAEDLSTVWKLNIWVDGTKGWQQYNFVKKSGESAGSVAYYTLPLNSGEHDMELIKNGTTYYKNSGTFKSDNCTNWTFTTSANRGKIDCNITGNYIFKIDFSKSDPKVSVTYPTSYKVKFGVGDGGSSVTAKIDNTTSINSGDLVLSGSSVTFHYTAKSGYRFTGWYTAASGGDLLSSTDADYVTTISAVTNVYAQFEEIKHTVTVSAGANGSIDPAAGNYSIGVVGQTFTPNPATGYYHKDWTTTGGASVSNNKITANDEGTATANFAPTWSVKGFGDWSTAHNFENYVGNEGTVTISLAKGASQEFLIYGHGIDGSPFYNSGTMVRGNSEGWTFSSNKDTGGKNAKITADVTGDYVFSFDISTKKLTVTYPTAYVVNFSSEPAALVTVTATVDAAAIATGDRVLAGKNVQFSAPATSGDYHFVCWKDGNDVQLSTDNPYTVSNISADVTVKAVYGGTTYAVTISSDDQGSVEPSGVQQVDNIAGTQITATATTAGYVFDRWVTTGNVSLTGGETDNPNTVKATGEGTVTAKYKQAQVVYFKNTLGWSNVYVYIFNQANVFDDAKGVCPSHSSRVAFSQMTLAQGETDVYVYTYDGALENMKSIAFCKDNQSTNQNFYQTKAAYRSDYAAANPMFVPQTTSNVTKNETEYYSTGTWFPFNTNKNYYIKFSDSETQYPLVFTTAGSLEATIGNIDLTAYTTYTFTLYDNAHPVDAEPVAYGREEAITYDKDNEYVSFTNTTAYPATLKTITGGNHTFSANFNSDVRPQIRIDFPTAYTLDYGVAPGGQSATAVRTGTTDTIASGAYVAPGQSVTLTQTASAGCNFVKWNTKADGTGTDLSSNATYTFDMPASAHTAYALYDGADVPSTFQILGTFNNWTSSSYMRSKSVVGELVYDSIYLEAGREYKFKVHNTSGSKWYGNTGIMTQAHCTQWTFTEGTGNCTLATTIAGWYKFTLNKSSLSLNVTFPENEKQATMYDSPVRSNNTDVMIQAFYWAHKGNTSEEYTAFGDVKWAKLNEEADTLAKYFDMVWLAPSQETADFTGYLPINYSNQGSTSATDGHSPWGTSADLRTLIDHLHNGGSKVIADIVINHSSAAHTDEYSGSSPNWCTWGSFDFGRYGVYNPDYTWLAKGDEMFYAKKTQAGACGQLDNTDNYEDEWNYSYKGGTGSWSESEFNCAYSRDWAHKKQEVREMSRAYLTWMRDSIGYDGWRYDFAKGFHGSHLYDYNRSTGAYFSVAEVFDGDIDKQLGVLADAGNSTYMFDFPGKFNLYNYAIREYRLENLKGNYNTLIGNDANKKYAVTFIDNHDSFHEEGKSLNYKANTIDDRQAQQAICYLFSMPGVPCLVYPYWNNYKEIVKKVIYARKAAGIHSQSSVEGDWGACEKEDDRNNNTYYNAKIKGDNGYIFLKLGKKGAPLTQPESGYTLAWGNEQAAVWYKTNKAVESKYRLLITANGQTYYSNDVNRNGQTLSFYATPDAKYQWQKYEMFQWKDCPGTAPVALTSYVYTATFDSVNMAATDMAQYEGDYYIRTDAVGWDDYKKDNHKFTYFANASVAAGDAYHYYWVKNIAKSSQVNVHATVGNEYNEHVTNTLGTDQFTDSEGKVTGDSYGINIRFSYEPTTNYLGRAMILGSTNNKYLNVVGSNIYKEKACTTPLDESHYTSTPADSKLGDISDWVYERVVFVKITDAKPSSNVVIKSVFKTTPSSAEQTQYMLGFQRDFYGNLTDDPVQYAVLDEGTTKSETTAYCIRVIYDFKTNRLVGAWEPVDQVVTDDWNIDADVMFKRYENGNTAQITFAKDGDTISSLKNVLFIMEFHRDTLPSQENLYWFSLPYDCNISSIYGVEGYVTLDNSGLPTQGTWGIQRYDGETRAKTGWFKEDTKTFWKWMGKDEVLHAGEGYVLDFDKSCATFNEIEVEEVNPSTGEVTKGKKSILRLYFPSDKPGFSMTKSGAVDSVNYADHTCNIKNRKAQDSNWRLMSPGNYSNTTIANEKDIRYDEKDSVLTAIPAFIYRYDRSKDAGSRYTAVSALSGFTYKSFNCYMAQFSGAVKWAQYTKADATTVAARQYYAPGEIRLANLKLVMENSYGEQQDHTFIKLKKGATTGYDANADLTKIVNSGIGQVYSVSEDVDYAANVLPVESQTVALKVVAAKAGSYTFSMPDGTDGVTATLVDTRTGSRTDLSLWNYTVELGKDTYAGRFYLDIDVHKTPTNVVVTEGDSENEGDKMMKFIENGQLYILKNGVIYDATGKIVK